MKNIVKPKINYLYHPLKSPTMKKVHFFSVILSLGLVLCACNSKSPTDTTVQTETFKTHGQAGVVDKTGAQNILQIAAGSEAHTTLAVAVVAANMQDVLANAGPLTVFAPTNAAFEKLPEGTVEELLKPENQETLARLIQFHAAPGTYKGKLLKDGQKLFQASGHYIDVVVNDEGTFVNGSKIIATIDATNGVVHVVEDVFLPPAEE
jgi:uncharacterized surface protein with fasciclin (FAS1) repeats